MAVDQITHRNVHRRTTVLVFERGPDKRPTSSLQVTQMGDNALIDSLMGPGFYRLMERVGLQPFTELGIHFVYAAVTDLHLQVMRERMPLLRVTRLRGTVVDGIAMNWVEISASGNSGLAMSDSTFAAL
ncbi:hypothetical protein [Variovorax sp. HJSM1_2]|uniref:hypothetical protein n=1 Tax=Variovorax sp. HJSM1_2 TaxID=3366263 RepID=UPI003BEAB553